MSPPGQAVNQQADSGVSTSHRSQIEYGIRYLQAIINEACAVQEAADFYPYEQLSPSCLSRIVRRWYYRDHRKHPELIDYLQHRLQLSIIQRDRITTHTGWERVLMYLDPTGNEAVRNVLRDKAYHDRLAARRRIAARHHHN